MSTRFQVTKHGTLFYISDTLTLKSTEQGPFDSEADCQSRADEMNAAIDAIDAPASNAAA